jgi:hypothetical protein
MLKTINNWLWPKKIKDTYYTIAQRAKPKTHGRYDCDPRPHSNKLFDNISKSLALSLIDQFKVGNGLVADRFIVSYDDSLSHRSGSLIFYILTEMSRCAKIETISAEFTISSKAFDVLLGYTLIPLSALSKDRYDTLARSAALELDWPTMYYFNKYRNRPEELRREVSAFEKEIDNVETSSSFGLHAKIDVFDDVKFGYPTERRKVEKHDTDPLADRDVHNVDMEDFKLK